MVADPRAGPAHGGGRLRPGGRGPREVEASFVVDTTEKQVVCLKPSANPQELIEEYGLRDVTLVAIPEGAERGGGWLISHRPPADSWEAQALSDELCDDPGVCFCETDRCRIYLPEAWGEGLAAPQETTVVEDDEEDRPGGYLILKGEAKTGTGEPLAGTFVLVRARRKPHSKITRYRLARGSAGLRGHL